VVVLGISVSLEVLIAGWFILGKPAPTELDFQEYESCLVVIQRRLVEEIHSTGRLAAADEIFLNNLVAPNDPRQTKTEYALL